MAARIVLCLAGVSAAATFLFVALSPISNTHSLVAGEKPSVDVDRSPVNLALTPDGKWLLTANQTADTVSLVRIADGSVAAEVACGSHPSAIVITPDGRRHWQAYVRRPALRVRTRRRAPRARSERARRLRAAWHRGLAR